MTTTAFSGAHSTMHDAFAINHREIQASLLAGRHNELARAITRARIGVEGSGYDGIASAAAIMNERLEDHAAMQEKMVFPAFVVATTCSAALFERVTADAATLFDGASAVIAACADLEERHARMLSRIAVDLLEHLNDEEQLFRAWLRL